MLIVEHAGRWFAFLAAAHVLGGNPNNLIGSILRFSTVSGWTPQTQLSNSFHSLSSTRALVSSARTPATGGKIGDDRYVQCQHDELEWPDVSFE